ncbi:hypothetical protein GS894_24170 [Rhodococcus hoagii]|nr:hypothetical protein [Prescottella equi]NKS05221.1 hypothetical protein [Prescottella equi]NKS86984.1 hypothetical protein [Prescottella equi]NKS92670.1 hypothetical protein [Prescottella equi]NKT12100.1 hypothetical protein [Prescottella equi]
MNTLRVTVSRWQCRGPWWQARRRVAGLELDIEHHGTTQTYGRRDFDAARIAVLDYLAVTDTPVAADTVIEWVETGR